MDHQQAIATHAAERYLLNELADADRDAFEDHYFSCATCAEDVKAGAQMQDGVRAGMLDTVATERSAKVIPIESRRRPVISGLHAVGRGRLAGARRGLSGPVGRAWTPAGCNGPIRHGPAALETRQPRRDHDRHTGPAQV